MKLYVGYKTRAKLLEKRLARYRGGKRFYSRHLIRYGITWKVMVF
jgi:hypothetical protein